MNLAPQGAQRTSIWRVTTTHVEARGPFLALKQLQLKLPRCTGSKATGRKAFAFSPFSVENAEQFPVMARRNLSRGIPAVHGDPCISDEFRTETAQLRFMRCQPVERRGPLPCTSLRPTVSAHHGLWLLSLAEVAPRRRLHLKKSPFFGPSSLALCPSLGPPARVYPPTRSYRSRPSPM